MKLFTKSLLPAVVFLSAWAATSAAAAGVARFERASCAFAEVDAAWPTQQNVECGWLRVPENHAKPRGRTIKIWVAIARAPTGNGKVADPILYIQGGPGVATVDSWFPRFPKSVNWSKFREKRDIVFFDQRGTGRSEPKFCSELAATLKAIDADDPPATEESGREVAAFKACRASMPAKGFDLSAFSSEATVGDAEALRRALGYPAWNIYSISYGTFVALHYLRVHPAGVRSALLDSPYPPNSVAWAEQITTTARAYAAIERSCDADPVCAKRFPDIGSRLKTAIARLNAAPVKTETGRITGKAFADALWTLTVQSMTVKYVPLVIDRAAAGDEAVIRALVVAYGGSDTFGSFSHGQAQAVNCREGGSVAASTREAMRRYPHLAGDVLPDAHERLCAVWQPERAPVALFAPVASDIPVLLYAGEFDPATPPEDAFQAARFLANSTIVPVTGAAHAPLFADDCTRGIAHAFFADPQAALNLRCLAERPPFSFATDGLDAFLATLKLGR